MTGGLTVNQAAQQQLSKLYAALSEERGQPPTLDEFYPIDVERLVVALEWRVEVVDTPAYVGPFARAHALSDTATKTIHLDKTEGQGRRRFTLAHELGHIVLHPGLSLARSSPHETLRSSRGTVKPPVDPAIEALEVMADRFAASLLMPAKAARRVFARAFQVPVMIAEEAARLLQCPANRDRFDLSKRLARWAPEGQPSFCTTFGVSAEAAGSRILQLELLK